MPFTQEQVHQMHHWNLLYIRIDDKKTHAEEHWGLTLCVSGTMCLWQRLSVAAPVCSSMCL